MSLRVNFLMGVAVLAVAIGGALFVVLRERSGVKSTEDAGMEKSELKASSSVAVLGESGEDANFRELSAERFSAPIDRAKDRVTKKPFGIFIDPKTSPVQPERFRGYHTGVDFETFPEEADQDVPIRAICEGNLVEKRSVSGYGGVVTQACMLDGEPVIVLYGHLRLSSVATVAGDRLVAGEKLGVLGTDSSVETDGERKHLHLSISRGSGTDVRGYVSSESALSAWIDPCPLVCE